MIKHQYPDLLRLPDGTYIRPEYVARIAVKEPYEGYFPEFSRGWTIAIDEAPEGQPYTMFDSHGSFTLQRQERHRLPFEDRASAQAYADALAPVVDAAKAAAVALARELARSP